MEVNEDVKQQHEEADKNTDNKDNLENRDNPEENNSDTDISSISEFVASDSKVKVGFQIFYPRFEIGCSRAF